MLPLNKRGCGVVDLAMFHTAQVEDGGEVFTLVSIDGENFFPIPFDPQTGDEEEIVRYIAPRSEQDEPYMGFSKAYLDEKGATFRTL